MTLRCKCGKEVFQCTCQEMNGTAGTGQAGSKGTGAEDQPRIDTMDEIAEDEPTTKGTDRR